MVSPGDTVAEEDPLITLESDKATMDVPSPAAGTVGELKVSVGDTVSEGTVILTLEGAAGAGAAGGGGAGGRARRGRGARGPGGDGRAGGRRWRGRVRDGRGPRPGHRRLLRRARHRGDGPSGRP